MRRSTVINHSNEKNQVHQSNKRKRSLEETSSSIKSKKRRHLSLNHSSSSIGKRKSKKRSSFNHSKTKKASRTSHRHSYSIEPLKDITLPNWECISPNIDQILSNKHTQSGVYAHEVHLVQQELEALLSMSILRENLLQDLLLPNNPEIIRSKILQHKEAEDVYTSKKLPTKLLPPLVNHQSHRQNNSHLLLDRQVAMAPVIGARIDKIWSDINTYYRKISSNDILTIENLLQFNQQLEEKIQQYEIDYRNNILTQMNITERLNEENFQELSTITETNSLTRHYIDRTTIGRFQRKLYERVPHTSPVYKTPISSPFYRKSLGNSFNTSSSLRSSPRLHSNPRIKQFSVPNFKSIDPSSSINLQERVQSVRDYLADQHPSTNERIKRPVSPNLKSTKKHKNSTHCTDQFQSKLSTLITLLHECSNISLSAVKRARFQSHSEQTWQKLTTIEHDLELLIEKVDPIDGENNSSNSEKIFQTLDHLLNDWKKYEDDLDEQLDC